LYDGWHSIFLIWKSRVQTNSTGGLSFQFSLFSSVYTLKLYNVTLKYARTVPSTSLIIYNLLLPLYFVQYLWIKVASINKPGTPPY
jgi:hypothetical protein